MPSGADLEYARMLAAAGITQPNAQGYDGAYLEQLGDERYQDGIPRSAPVKKHAPSLGLYFPEAEGAKGDGVTDDTLPIQACIALAQAAGGGTVVLGGSTYAVTSITAAAKVKIAGFSRYFTVLKALPSPAAGVVMFPSGQVQAFYMEDVQIIPGTVPNIGQHGIYAHAHTTGGATDGGWWYGGLRRVRVNRFSGHGIWLRGGGSSQMFPHQFLTFEHVEVFSGTLATSRSLYVTGQVGQVNFTNCELDGNGQGAIGLTTGVDIRREVQSDGVTNLSDTSPYAIVFSACTFQGHTLAARVERAASVVFLGCWFEDNKNGVNFETVAENGLVLACTFSDTGDDGTSTGYCIRAGSNSHITAMNNRFLGARNYDMRSDSTNGHITAVGNIPVGNATVAMSSGLTKQPSVSSNAIDMGSSRTAILGSGLSFHTITSKLGPGERITIRQFGASTFSVTSGGNINLGVKASPIVVPLNGVVEFVRMDLGVTWQLAAMYTT